jgi:Tol biopolymer transport system component
MVPTPRLLSRISFAGLVAILVVAGFAPSGRTQNPARPSAPPKSSLAEPGISPDGSEIAFVSGGDIWIVPAAGGEAHLLVSHPATESRPLYSPDGRRLAFISNRVGSPDMWLLTFATGELTQLTYDDGTELLAQIGRTGKP